MRQARVEDVTVMVDIMGKSRANLPHDRRMTADELRGFIFGDPDYDPDANMMVLEGGRPVGFVSVAVERMRLAAGKDDGIIDMEIIPERRGGGKEDELVAWGLDFLRAKSIGTARVRVEIDNVWKSTVATLHAFEEKYRILDLTRRGKEPLPKLAPIPGVRLERRMLKDYSDEEIVWLNDLFNETFKDHYNSVPTPVERLLNMRDVSQELFMVTTAMSDDRPVGICLTEESIAFNREKGTRTGWIVLLGVVQRHRRSGIGKLLLVDGMEWLVERGMDTLNISLVSKNDKAMSLYTSLGFEKWTGAVWYARPV